ncbi:MAG: glycosyltransferase [Vagococcus sp.]|uniref:glycosyltransferase family 2 protein n=1 Tax=Vagococcus sp. TaxID=1933889 RepID=UPI002FC9FD10
MGKWLIIFALISIWMSVSITVLILFGAIKYLLKILKSPKNELTTLSETPMVTVIVPAHNEELVIGDTISAILNLNYPKDSLEIKIVADNCQDQTLKMAEAVILKENVKGIDIEVIDRKGTGGKAGVLNDMLKIAKGKWICVYDADAMPEKNSLYFLVKKALEDKERYGAVFGRNKTRNYKQNFLTRCINLEIVTTQRIHHTGQWELFKIGRIPGTNFIIKTEFVRNIGGWDNGALTEDTAISFKIMESGKLIALAPHSEAFQQEPETLEAYYHQRKRWAKGNYEVILDNFKHLFDGSNWRIKLEVLYYTSTFFWFNLSILLSNFLFLSNLLAMIVRLFRPDFSIPFTFGGSNREIAAILLVNWLLMFIIYLLQINIALVSQYGQETTTNLFYSVISYFTYAQFFIVVATSAFFSLIFDKLFKRDGTKWYKTQRFNH